MKFGNLILTCVLAASSAAQTNNAPVGSDWTNIPYTDLGTLDLVTGVIHPPNPAGSQPASAPVVVYDNTCLPYAPATPTGCGIVYYDPQLAANKAVLDDGRMPSVNSPAPATGVMNAYRVTQFRIIYYTSEQDTTIGGPGCRLTVKFWEDLDSCTNLTATPVANATFNLNLPGSTIPLAIQGFAININLVGGLEFTMKADANGTFDNAANLDTFGVGFIVNTITSGEQTRITRAGQPTGGNSCGIGDATYFQNSTSTAGTGLDNSNNYWYQQTAAIGTCVAGIANQTACPAVPGPNHGGFYLRVWADLTDCNSNRLPDFDDIASGFSQDVNVNGIPDECEITPVINYCTGGTTLNNCVAAISSTGSTSVSAASGFIVNVSNVEGQKQGIIFYGTTIPIASPWGSSSSFLCVKAPTQRTGVQNTGGAINTCGGALTLNFFNYLSNNPSAQGNPFAAGQKAYFQGWFRDQGSPKTTSLSDALQVTFVP